MKKILVVSILPIVLFALERVNLIKDHSFEKDGEVWREHTSGSGFPVIAEANRHDSYRSTDGFYSAYGDTRTEPSGANNGYREMAIIDQGFVVTKKVEDIDSLFISYSIYPQMDSLFGRSDLAIIALYLDALKAEYWKAGYVLKASDFGFNPEPPLIFFDQINFPEDTLWHLMEKDIRSDLEENPQFTLSSTVDSIILEVQGIEWNSVWRGQKVYCDDVRLMGYADYDVGVKSILDPVESCEQSPDGNSSLVPSYTPVALIKNFGRENAKFAVIAEICDGDTQVYYDSLDWSLTSDTEDTVTFASFTPPDTGTHTLTIRTFMEPDESDADDELTKELDFTGITEVVTPTNLTLDIANTLTSSSPLRVSYSLPTNQTGTISVYDQTGRRIQRQSVTGTGKVDFNTQLPAGMYIVRLESGGEAVSRKAIILQ